MTKKSQKVRFTVLLCLLLTILLGTTWTRLFNSSLHTVSVSAIDPQMASIKCINVHQELILEGSLQKIQINCSAPSGSLYGDAKVKIALSQGDKTILKTISAQEIGNTLQINFLPRSFHSGNVELTIYGEDFPDGTDLYLLVSSDTESGLENAFMDASSVPGPLALSYTIMRHNAAYYYDIVFIVLNILLCVVTAWLMTYKKDWLSEGTHLFVLSAVFLFVYISLKNPMASLLAEPFSEVAYEFWYKARYYGFFQNLMSLMSGESLTWLERILMWIAVRISGDGKYVIVVAQLMQVILISSFASMLALPTFKKYFPLELRFFICWYLGGMMLFPSAYYFWGVSYWACFFILPFAFVDMDHLKRWQYTLALCFTVVLCVSRIYHVLFIPMALLTLLLVGKERGKRFQGYCLTVAVASTFEVCYSMIAGGSSHIDLKLLRPIRFILNTVYYQVQVLSSLLFGDTKANSVLLNLVFLLFFLAILVGTLWMLAHQKEKKEYKPLACILLNLGLLSMGSIFINVTVCGCSKSVGFPKDYAATVNWIDTVFQEGDFHFSYAYYSTFMIFMICSYLLLQKYTSSIATKTENLGCGATYLASTVVLSLAFLSSVSSVYNIPMMLIDWKNTYQVTNTSSYFVPCNTSYMFSNIGLTHQADIQICGVAEDGTTVAWDASTVAYPLDKGYTEAQPGAVFDFSNRAMLSLSTTRKNWNFARPVYLILRDSAGNQLARVKQTNDSERIYAVFMLPEPLYNVYSVSFEYEDGSLAVMRESMSMGTRTW